MGNTSNTVSGAYTATCNTFVFKMTWLLPARTSTWQRWPFTPPSVREPRYFSFGPLGPCAVQRVLPFRLLKKEHGKTKPTG